jgi:hypothetical protein
MKLIQLTESQYEKLMSDKRRLDALDAVLAEHASSAPWGWRWSPSSREDMPRLHLSQDGKLRSARDALDVLANNAMSHDRRSLALGRGSIRSP